MISPGLIHRLVLLNEKTFGKTDLSTRMRDIDEEAFELRTYNGDVNLREETGDLLASVLMLCHELGYEPDALLMENILKIEARVADGHYLRTGEQIREDTM